MDRKRIPTEIETAVLIKSARRCTLCFHWLGDLNEKHGQIAHLDKDPSNFAEDNLVFMCLDHHTLFDSKTSQHKNYTMQEVKTARYQLYDAIAHGQHAKSAASDVQMLRRRLTPHQQTLIAQELRIGGIGHVTIQYLRTGNARIDKEPGDFAEQMSETPRRARWEAILLPMSSFRGWLGTSITKQPGGAPLPEAQTLFRALSAAGVEVYFNETGLPIDDRPMMLIGKNDH